MLDGNKRYTATVKLGITTDTEDITGEVLTRHEVHFHWLKGHAGHAENERCDELARAEASKSGLSPDTGFSE